MRFNMVIMGLAWKSRPSYRNLPQTRHKSENVKKENGGFLRVTAGWGLWRN
jgi:hypothetical protein